MRRGGAGLGLIALIALVAVQLRSIILGVPPVLPQIRDELQLSFAAAGALTAIPVICLGLAAIGGAVLVNRIGPRQVVGFGLLGLGTAAILRLAPPQPYALFLFSGLMALCVAVAQPAILTFIRYSFPDRIQQVSTVYATSLGLGGLLGASLTVRLAAATGWRWTFVLWALPALAVAAVWFQVAPGRNDAHVARPAGLGRIVRQRPVWHVAGLFGAQSLIFYGAATWIPFALRREGPATLALVLLLLNFSSLPIAVVLLLVRWPWATSRLFYALAGVGMTIGTLGFATGSDGLAWLWVSLTGTCIAAVFNGTTALPGLLSVRRADVAGFAAIVLMVGYAIAFAGPLLGGVMVDHTHRFTTPFWMMAGAGLAVIALAATLPRPPGAPSEEVYPASSTTAVP